MEYKVSYTYSFDVTAEFSNVNFKGNKLTVDVRREFYDNIFDAESDTLVFDIVKGKVVFDGEDYHSLNKREKTVVRDIIKNFYANKK